MLTSFSVGGFDVFLIDISTRSFQLSAAEKTIHNAPSATSINVFDDEGQLKNATLYRKAELSAYLTSIFREMAVWTLVHAGLSRIGIQLHTQFVNFLVIYLNLIA